MNRKTLSFTLIIMLLFVQSIDFTSSQSDSRLTLDQYDVENDEWTKLVLTDRKYIIESDDSYIDQLEGSLMVDPWFAINSGANESNFFNLELDELNSTYILRIESDGGDNEIRINTLMRHWSTDLNPLLDLVDSIFDRITGKDLAGVWPVDMSVAIMESYPEQYAVTVMIQRGYDDLTYTGHPITNFALVVSDVYDPNNSYEPNWIFNASIVIWGNVTLSSSGELLTYNFPTFTFGLETDFDNLGFMIILESGTYLKSHPKEGYLPFIGSVDPLVYDDLSYSFLQTSTFVESFPSVPAFLPFPWFMSIVSILAIPITRKKYN